MHTVDLDDLVPRRPVAASHARRQRAVGGVPRGVADRITDLI
jgi:hypothetical protein